MSNTLVDQYIDDTFEGILHLGGKELPEDKLSPIYDGKGNPSSISIGRESIGVKMDNVTVVGNFNHNSIDYPKTPPGPLNLVVSDKFSPNILRFLSLPNVLSLLGASNETGTFENPTITLNNGLITSITSNPSLNTQTKGMFSYTNSSSPNVFTVPVGVTVMKFTITGGGSSGGTYSGSSGATITGYLTVSEGQNFLLTVGAGGGNVNHAPGKNSTIKYNGIDILTAEGGNTLSSTGANAIINNQFNNIISSLVIQGGLGTGPNLFNDERMGASSFWGSSPTYGAGGKSKTNKEGSSGIILFEW